VKNILVNTAAIIAIIGVLVALYYWRLQSVANAAAAQAQADETSLALQAAQIAAQQYVPSNIIGSSLYAAPVTTVKK
jgi:hypothetical protein